MIPFVLATIGGYLIGTASDEKFDEGGGIDYELVKDMIYDKYGVDIDEPKEKLIGKYYKQLFPNIKDTPIIYRIRKKSYYDAKKRLELNDYKTKGLRTQDLNKVKNLGKYLPLYEFLSSLKLDSTGKIVEIIKYASGGGIINKKSRDKLLPFFVVDSYGKIKNTKNINELLKKIGIPIKVTKFVGSGAFGSAYLTTKNTILKITESESEFYANYRSTLVDDLKSHAKIYNIFAVTTISEMDSHMSQYFFIEKEKVDKVIDKLKDSPDYIFGKSGFGDEIEDIIKLNYKYKNLTDEQMLKKAENIFNDEKKFYEAEVNEKEYKELLANKKEIINRLYQAFKFAKYLAMDDQKLKKVKVESGDIHSGNYGVSKNRFVCFDCLETKYIKGGEI